MKKIVISSPNIKSNALKELANELTKRVGYRVFRVTPNNVRGRRSIVFNLGLDKLSQFTRYSSMGVSAPAHCSSLRDVHNLPGKQVVVRSLINSSEGKGITICNKEECTINAPLYTEYIPKKKEFRVHIWDNKVFDVQEKRKRRVAGVEEKEFQVRNTANGYVFCREGIVEPADLRSVALSAVLALERTYGAVDVIYNEKRNKCYVLEVNQRPGMQGTTLQKYADAILESLNEG